MVLESFMFVIDLCDGKYEKMIEKGENTNKRKLK